MGKNGESFCVGGSGLDLSGFQVVVFVRLVQIHVWFVDQRDLQAVVQVGSADQCQEHIAIPAVNGAKSNLDIMLERRKEDIAFIKANGYGVKNYMKGGLL